MNPKIQLSINMLRAFVTLADRLNLSYASSDLGLTRQTVRRHLDELEIIRKEKLLTLDRGRYALTPAGAQFLNDAKDILWRADASDMRNPLTLQKIDGCEHLMYRAPDGHTYYSQQHRLSALNTHGLPLLREMLRAWGASSAQLEHPEMDSIRPYLLVYRWIAQGWLCADVGEKSAYWRWLGPDMCKSAKGALADRDGAGDAFIALVSNAYAEIYYGGSIRLDHLYVRLPREGFETPQRYSYQRMLASCILPNGQQALAVLSATTNKIEIDALDKNKRILIEEKLLMDDEYISLDQLNHK